MSFFGNDAINRVTLHSTIQALAQGAGGVFVFVFLLKAGVPAPLVFCTLAAMNAGRFALRPLVLIVGRRFGLRSTLMIGTVLEAAIFPMLPYVHGPGPLLLALIAVSALGSVFYWTSLHAVVAALGDAEHRGKQIGVRAAATAAMSIVAPWLGGWGLTALGPAPTFALVAGVQAAAALPLLGAPNPPVVEHAPGGWRAARRAVAMQAADGWFSAGFFYVWQIALFLTLGERFADFGGAMALAGVAGAAGGLVIGRFIDLGHGRRSLGVAYAACVGVLILKAVSLHSPALAVLANALATVALILLEPVMMAPIYNMAQASPCPLRFHMATEGGWDTGCAVACLIAAAMVWARLPLSAPILLGLGGAAAGFVILRRSYAAPAPAPAPAGT